MLQSHETWGINDASKLKTYLTCPRKYFYEYILGWRLDVPQHALVFGEAWHRAMAYIHYHGFHTIETAMLEEFTPFYRTQFGPETDLDKAPKNPGYALDALINYVQRYKSEDTFQVHHVEVYGVVNIADNDKLHFRLDTVCEDSRGMFCLEHKTTSMDTATWDAEWQLSMQTNLYNHVLLCMYGFDHTFGTVVNGTVFRKSGFAFKRIPVRPVKNMMNAWIEETRNLVDRIKADIDKIESPYADQELTMTAFPRATESCTKYNRVCAYHPFCTAWANPLARCEDVPEGFCIDRWNPADAAKESGKEVVEV